MFKLTDREKYCISILIMKGEETHFEEILDIILDSRESFEGLDEKYLKHQALKRTLNSLVKKGIIAEDELFYKVNPVIEIGFIKEYPTIFLKAIKANQKCRDKHVLEFCTREIEEILLNEALYDEPPYELIAHLNEALDLHRRNSFDLVLVKCGKTVEIIVDEMNEDYNLFEASLSTGNMINQLKNDKIISKIDAKKKDVKTFADGLAVVYRFRNIMGAHSNKEGEWGLDQVATSCLLLTLYLADFYMTKIGKT